MYYCVCYVNGDVCVITTSISRAARWLVPGTLWGHGDSRRTAKERAETLAAEYRWKCRWDERCNVPDGEGKRAAAAVARASM